LQFVSCIFIFARARACVCVCACERWKILEGIWKQNDCDWSLIEYPIFISC